VELQARQPLAVIHEAGARGNSLTRNADFGCALLKVHIRLEQHAKVLVAAGRQVEIRRRLVDRARRRHTVARVTNGEGVCQYQVLQV
jgi:hypothetical protein